MYDVGEVYVDPTFWQYHTSGVMTGRERPSNHLAGLIVASTCVRGGPSKEVSAVARTTQYVRDPLAGP